MAKASGDAYSELIIMGAVGLAVFVLVKRQQQRPLYAVDPYGNPISAAYGVGALGPPVYGANTPYGHENTAPDILNAFANFFNSTANAGAPLLQPSLPLGQAGIDNPPPYY